jgi:hypothetical protein
MTIRLTLTRVLWKLDLVWLLLRYPFTFKEARFQKCKKLMDALVADGILEWPICSRCGLRHDLGECKFD